MKISKFSVKLLLILLAVCGHIAYMWHLRGDFGIGGEWFVYGIALTTLPNIEIEWEK